MKIHYASSIRQLRNKLFTEEKKKVQIKSENGLYKCDTCFPNYLFMAEGCFVASFSYFQNRITDQDFYCCSVAEGMFLSSVFPLSGFDVRCTSFNNCVKVYSFAFAGSVSANSILPIEST